LSTLDIDLVSAMKEHLPWSRVLIVICLIIIFALPLVLISLDNPNVKLNVLWPFYNTFLNTNKEYAVINSNNPSYKLTISDAAYLDFVTAKLSLYDADAIVDPLYFQGNTERAKRYTIKKITYELVNDVGFPISKINTHRSSSSLSQNVGLVGYKIEKDTLIILVSLNFPVIEFNTEVRKIDMNETFSTLVLQALYMVKAGSPNFDESQEAVNVVKDIHKYINSGKFSWPFSIEKV
jgi:hypothetical protein